MYASVRTRWHLLRVLVVTAGMLVPAAGTAEAVSTDGSVHILTFADKCFDIGGASTSDGATVENPGKKSSKFSYTNSPVWVKTQGPIQITTSKSAQAAANSSRVLVRPGSNANANATRVAHRWH